MSIDLDAIRARWSAWYDGDYTWSDATWPDWDREELMDHYIARCDMPDLLSEVERLRAVTCTDCQTPTGGRQPHDHT